MKITKIETNKAPSAIGPYSQAVRVKFDELIYLSGQIPIIPETGEILTKDIKSQTNQVMKNIGAVLSADGLTYENVIKCTIFVTDLNDFASVNEVYGKYFANNPPARACVEVSALPKGVSVEIEAIAAK